MTILDTNYTNSGPIVQAKRLELVRELDEMLTPPPSWGQANHPVRGKNSGQCHLIENEYEL